MQSVVQPPKIVIIGAGSAVFGQRAVSAILRSPQLRGAHLCLVDVDTEALELMTQLAELMNT